MSLKLKLQKLARATRSLQSDKKKLQADIDANFDKHFNTIKNEIIINKTDTDQSPISNFVK